MLRCAAVSPHSSASTKWCTTLQTEGDNSLHTSKLCPLLPCLRSRAYPGAPTRALQYSTAKHSTGDNTPPRARGPVQSSQPLAQTPPHHHTTPEIDCETCMGPVSAPSSYDQMTSKHQESTMKQYLSMLCLRACGSRPRHMGPSHQIISACRQGAQRRATGTAG